MRFIYCMTFSLLLSCLSATTVFANDDYVVQIGNGATISDASGTANALIARFGWLIDRNIRIDANSHDYKNPRPYRVNVGPFPARKDAQDFCEKLRAAGGDCIVQSDRELLTTRWLDNPFAKAGRPVPLATTDRRVALVIGNSAYQHVPKLTNPARDAEEIGKTLLNIGFQNVIVRHDLTKERLSRELQNFALEAEKADWALVYFAGHGIEFGGANYLIPIDAKLAVDREVPLETVSLDQVLALVQPAKKLRIVLLDACRDNPFVPQMRRTVATRSVSRGLTPIEPEGGTLVVYAAKHGNYALDGTGKNSPFASALKKRLEGPGVEITKAFRLVRDDVLEETAGQQEPFIYGSLPGREDFFFVAK